MSDTRQRRWVALGTSSVLMLWAGALLLSHGACNSARKPMESPVSSQTRASRSDPPAAKDGLAPVTRRQLHVTQGQVESLQQEDGTQFAIEGPRQRAVVPETTGDEAELRFTWLGATHEVIPLASGQHREQVGLKLRARDGCNLLYAMWRIAPSAGIVVQFKSNPDDHASGECGNGGYTTVRPRFMEPLDRLSPGESHVLRALIDANVLTVYADGVRVWEGLLPQDALRLEGPAGMRTDNARVRFELLVPQAASPTSRR
ncbi:MULTISPECIES: hypothetical protein [unclassified Corallococcus]|uniref:hypothetical protein n=1 Tax=unclassified Corallococcus TaxID=2685029 RepID=UPI001A90CA03|nr:MULTISPECIES: hypothetical protein [unclassified Corallococcus]MBN9684704.1 hypothetical protein [Corallococcus sp. NCSPR001]WAS83824.1 hypothetical protein O0N60_31545 [Corallococcus sp. NCRR]